MGTTCTPGSLPWLQFIECHPALAAYAAVALAVIGGAYKILSPIFAQWWNGVRHRRQQRADGARIATAMIPHIEMFIRRIEERLALLEEEGRLQQSPGAQVQFFRQLGIEIPGNIDLSLMHNVDPRDLELGFALDFLSAARAYNNDAARAQVDGLKRPSWPDELHYWRERLVTLKAAATEFRYSCYAKK